MKKLYPLLLLLLLLTAAHAQQNTEAPVKAPFPYLWGTAHHILPETHSEESGYFSIAEGKNGRIYVGTAKYNHNAYLVEFDPQTGEQKIVIDTHKLNNLTDTGYAAQAKIHTRNFVGPSGKIYIGSQEGYRQPKNDESVYPGGYVMVYDPATEKAESLGMPMKGEGVIDVVADEARGLLYVVTTWGEDSKAHWLLGDLKTKTYRDLGPLPTNYASTLMDADGRAHVITADSRLATYDPRTDTTTTRDIAVGGRKWKLNNSSAIPTWQLTPDAKAAYLILMNDPSLHRIGFDGREKVEAEVLGSMLEGTRFDSRSSLTVAPDGRVYALGRVNNETGFGKGYLHHLTRYDPRTKKIEDLGVLAVKNPDFFDFGPRADGTKPSWSHGYQTLPDGTMTPLHGHQGLIATRSGDLYALILYPFTLLKIEGVGNPASAVATGTQAAQSPSQQYAEWALGAIDGVEKNLPDITRVAEVVAERHIKGGLLGFAWNSQSLQQELAGRAGGLMNIDFGRMWEGRSPEGDKHNVVIVGWDRAPAANELAALQKLKKAGTYIIGFGPGDLPELSEHVAISDAFFDTGLGADDRVVTLPNGEKAGRGNALVNMLHGWAFTGEFIAALTRRGKMPTIWKAWMYPDGKEWSEKYFRKMQFHDDFEVAPIAAGTISRAYLDEIRANIRRFEATQSGKVLEAARLIADESKAGKDVIVSTSGHAPWTYVGKYEDARWGTPFDLEVSVPRHVENYQKTPEGALVLRLGYGGMDEKTAKIFEDKKQRVILVSVPDQRPEFQHTQKALMNIDMGWEYGDAVVPIAGYPLKVLPPSGIMQIVAYESISTEVLARLAQQ